MEMAVTFQDRHYRRPMQTGGVTVYGGILSSTARRGLKQSVSFNRCMHEKRSKDLANTSRQEPPYQYNLDQCLRRQRLILGLRTVETRTWDI